MPDESPRQTDLPRPRLLVLCVLSICAAAVNPASAQSRSMSVTMEWERAPGAEGCLDAERLAREVEERLRRPVFAPGDSPLVLQGRITPRRRRPGFEATLRMVRASGELLGERDLASEATDCAELTDSLSLIAALMVDLPQRGLRLSVPQPEPEPPAIVEPTDLDPASAPQPVLALGVGGALAVGLHPDPAPGVRASLRWTPPAFIPIELDAAYWFKGEAAVSNGGGEFQSAHVGLAACPVFIDSGVLRASACAGIASGLVRGSGFGFDRSRKESSLLINGTLTVPLRLRTLPWLAIELSPGIAVPFVRDEFLMREADGEEPRIHRLAPILITGHLSLSFTP